MHNTDEILSSTTYSHFALNVKKNDDKTKDGDGKGKSLHLCVCKEDGTNSYLLNYEI